MANNTLNGKPIPTSKDPKGWIHKRLSEFGLFQEKYSASKHKDYTKFMVMRHPFDRLISAYHDKAFPHFINNGKAITRHYSKHISKWVIKQYHKTDTSINKRDFNATFWEFGKYIFHKGDRHWSPYHSVCGECIIDYDFILRTETLDADSKSFLEKSYPELSGIPAYNAMRKTHNAKQNLKTVKFLNEFGTLGQKLIMKLMQKYKLDMEPFGYNYDMQTQTATCSFSATGGPTCC